VRDEDVGEFNALGVNRKHLIAVSQECFAFEDYPWCCDAHLVAKMKELRPDARFILTVRDPHTWWASVSHWVTLHPAKRPVYERLLNTRPLHREGAVRAMEEHNARVRALFTGPDRHRLIEVNIEAEDPGSLARRLCAFLGMGEVYAGRCRTTFPHRNRARYNARHARRLGTVPHDPDADGGDAMFFTTHGDSHDILNASSSLTTSGDVSVPTLQLVHATPLRSQWNATSATSAASGQRRRQRY